MLLSLSIQNYALISELHIDFERGFSVITGETGAGKSILLGAIGLLLGGRAETRMLKAGAKRCTIEAEFDLDGYHMDGFFEDNDIDFDGRSCIIRRELTDTGKSRAFINDTPAQVAQLRALGSQLIDIHSQHQNLLLGQEDFQLNVLDIIAQDQSQREVYTACYNAYHTAQRRLQEAEAALSRGRDDEDYLRFQLEQLDELLLGLHMVLLLGAVQGAEPFVDRFQTRGVDINVFGLCAKLHGDVLQLYLAVAEALCEFLRRREQGRDGRQLALGHPQGG